MDGLGKGMGRVFVGAVALGAMGCASPFTPLERSGASGAGGAGGSMSAGGGAGGSATGCDPSLEKNAVGNTCGVFVSASKGDDALGDGTKEKPFKSIGKAVAAKKAIYLCGESFSESVTLPSGIALYGALACAQGWHYDAGKKTTLTADADKVPLTLTKGDGESEIADLAITSKDATKPGGSSIAVLAVEAKATLKRVELTAGKGAPGADAPADVPDPMLDGDKGKSPATPGCSTTMGVIGGGGGGQKTCQGNVIANGGLGGSGTMDTTGGPGGNGKPYPSGDVNNGKGGKEQDATSCDNGKDGVKGSPGTPGNGAKGLGKLDAGGYSGNTGDPGASAGTPGQGGGGGGGNSNAACTAGTKDGPAGGGGGSGGCGGKPGTGGLSGGASFSVVSVTSTLSIADAKVTATDGGAGGKGSAGQPGGIGLGGGQGEKGTISDACNGGKGGPGGQGGAGGGGLGGHSIGIAYTGMAPAMMTNVTLAVGKAGSGGAGGDGGASNQGGKGDDGVSEKVKAFDGK